MRLKSLAICSGLAVTLLANWASATLYNVQPLMINGPDSQKKIIAIIGDGYDAFSMDEFAETVDSYILQGVFLQDETYRNNSTAFNVYRIDAVSNDYGVSVRTTYEFPAGSGTQVASDATDPYYDQNTALGFIQSGIWDSCWMAPGPNTDATLTDIMSTHLSRQPDIIMSVLNVQPFMAHTGVFINRTFGGCARGSRLAVTNHVGYSVAAHEWGHSIGGLRDEYVAYSTPYPGPAITGVTNCSTVLNKNTVSWASLVSTDSRLTIPTVYDGTWMDYNKTVGEYEGCNYYPTGVYRPALSCRMNGNSPGFCPVCKGIFETAVTPFRDQLSNYFDTTTYLGARCRSTDGDATYTTDGAASNGSTSATMTLECGARRLQNAGVFSGRIVASATVIDQSPSSDVCCALIARDPSGAQVSGAQVCSTGSGASAQVLPLVYPKLTVGSTTAHLDVECTVPPVAGGLSSSVFNYQIAQQVQTF